VDQLLGVGKLTVEVDGKLVTVTSIGDVEHDQKNDGSNAKHAESDAFKRCAMKLGLGLICGLVMNTILTNSLIKKV